MTLEPTDTAPFEAQAIDLDAAVLEFEPTPEGRGFVPRHFEEDLNHPR